jgi:hypothetical protein
MIVGSAQADYWNTGGDASALKRLDFLKKMAWQCGSNMSLMLTQNFESRFLVEAKDDDAGFRRMLDLYKDEMISYKTTNMYGYNNLVSSDVVAALLLSVLLKMNFADVFHVAEAPADSDCEDAKIAVWVVYVIMTTLNVVSVEMENLPENIYMQLSYSIMKQKPIAIEWAIVLMHTLSDAYGEASANRSGQATNLPSPAQ